MIARYQAQKGWGYSQDITVIHLERRNESRGSREPEIGRLLSKAEAERPRTNKSFSIEV